MTISYIFVSVSHCLFLNVCSTVYDQSLFFVPSMIKSFKVQEVLLGLHQTVVLYLLFLCVCEFRDESVSRNVLNAPSCVHFLVWIIYFATDVVVFCSLADFPTIIFNISSRTLFSAKHPVNKMKKPCNELRMVNK